MTSPYHTSPQLRLLFIHYYNPFYTLSRRRREGESEIRACNGHWDEELGQYWRDLKVIKEGLVVHGTRREVMGSILENGLGGKEGGDIILWGMIWVSFLY